VLQFQLLGGSALGSDFFELQRAIDRGGNLCASESNENRDLKAAESIGNRD
jgi:hypothetical protein